VRGSDDRERLASGGAAARRLLDAARHIRDPDDSERRRRCLEEQAPGGAFDWVREPVLNRYTRLAVETSAATGELRVVGFEPAARGSGVEQATAVLDVVVEGEMGHPAALPDA
jgi:hypothetical protein